MRRKVLLFTLIAATLLIASGVALAATVTCDRGTTCVGTNKADRLTGTPGLDTMYGRGDGDAMYGRAAADTMFGGYGTDRIYGNAGNDTISGGPAADKIFGGPGTDTIDGNSGGDYINVAGDGVVDSIDCGIGKDTAVVDNADLGRATVDDYFRLTSCENVIVR